MGRQPRAMLGLRIGFAEGAIRAGAAGPPRELKVGGVEFGEFARVACRRETLSTAGAGSLAGEVHRLVVGARTQLSRATSRSREPKFGARWQLGPHRGVTESS